MRYYFILLSLLSNTSIITELNFRNESSLVLTCFVSYNDDPK